MVPKKLTLATLLTAFGVVITGAVGSPVPAGVHAIAPTDFTEVVECDVNCFTEQILASGMSSVIAMYQECLNQCGNDSSLASLSCKVTTCQHLGAAYIPPELEMYAKDSFAKCVESSCLLQG